jgi:hypothetical protein
MRARAVPRRRIDFRERLGSDTLRQVPCRATEEEQLAGFVGAVDAGTGLI